MTDLNYFEEKLNEIPEEVLIKAVEVMKNNIGEGDIYSIREAIDLYGSHEWIFKMLGGFVHEQYGQIMRNALRNAGLTDDLLPDNNWDDYYIQVIEIAVDKKPFPIRESNWRNDYAKHQKESGK